MHLRLTFGLELCWLISRIHPCLICKGEFQQKLPERSTKINTEANWDPKTLREMCEGQRCLVAIHYLLAACSSARVHHNCAGKGWQSCRIEYSIRLQTLEHAWCRLGKTDSSERSHAIQLTVWTYISRFQKSSDKDIRPLHMRALPHSQGFQAVRKLVCPFTGDVIVFAQK